ncbi:10372_t:CDS:2, partial [Racocetra fulgida]
KYGVAKTGKNNKPVAKATQSIKQHEKKLLNNEKAHKLGVKEELDHWPILVRTAKTSQKLQQLLY